MFKPKLYLPSNAKNTKPDNSFITDIKNKAISLLDWFSIDLQNGDDTKFLNQKGEWVEAAGNNIYNSDGVIQSNRNVNLDNKTLLFNSANNYLAFNQDPFNEGNQVVFLKYGLSSDLNDENQSYIVLGDDGISEPNIKIGVGGIDGDSITASISIEKKVDENITNIEILSNSGNILLQTESGNGNVGIGESNFTPTAKLDVIGDFKLVDGTQGEGKVLTSDADGLATWENISSILATLPSYANDAAAALGGLSVGDSYFNTTTSSYTRRLV